MARIRIHFPENISFQCEIPVRITDINYGGHVGNDRILSLIHEARMRWLQQYGYTEMNLAGCGLIMADAGIEFKTEIFYGDALFISVAVGEITRIGFELFYKLEKESAGQKTIAALAKTGMICYDYEAKKITGVPEELRKLLGGG